MKKIRLTLLALLLSTINVMAEDWMKNLPDNTYVAALSIPGTHDTATANGWKSLTGSRYSQTQDINFEAQWSLGIRAFDFRPKVDGSNLRCCHGIHETNLMFNDAMNSLVDWLDAHPTEFAVIHLLYADGYDSDKDKYKANLQNLMASDKLKDRIVDFRRDLTVGEMRGKILLLSRDEYDTTPMGGFLKNWCGYIDWNAQSNGWIAGAGSGEFSTGALYMQDLAETHESGKKEEKVRAIQRMLDYSTTHYSTDPRQQVWIMNFASAYSKVTSLPLIGNISLSEGYKDNAVTTNKAILDYLNDGSKVAGPTGIILMDYVGIDETSGNAVVQAIINQNFKYLNVEEKSLLGQPVSFIKDDDRGYTNKMGMDAKNFMPFVADFDGNGLMDVYFGGESWTQQNSFFDAGFVALNNGAGSYPAWDTQTDRTGSTIPIFYGARARVAFDMDQDGDLDAIVLDNRTAGWDSHPNVGYHSFRVIKNVDNGKRFEDITAQCGGLGDHQFNSDNNRNAGIHCVEVADVNMDGYPDILIQGERDNNWKRVTTLYINNGGNGFTELPNQFVDVNNGSVLFGDFNCDGYPDVVISGYTQGDDSQGVSGGDCFLLYKNDGTGHFTLDQNLSSRYGKSGDETVMHVVDYDQDGKQDILIIGSVPQVGLPAADNGKIAFILHNTSTGDGNISFEEVGTHIYPTSANGSRTSVLADFNGDGFVDYVARGWGMKKINEETQEVYYDWCSGIYASYSSGQDQYATAFNVISDEEGWMGFGDVDGDGMLDFMSPYNSDNGSPMFYRNTSLLGTNAQCEVPGAPTGVKAAYDKASKRLTLTWDKMTTSTGSKAIYNVYIVKDGKTFMRCPAVKATGKQTAYTSFGNYLPAETCFFDGIEPGVYEIGVQSVAYSWNASEFTTRTVAVLDEDTKVAIPTQADDADVCISRTLKAGQWNSFCVPFGMTQAQIQAAGLGEVKTLSSTQLNDGSCMLGFSDAITIEAGVPYMVCPTEDVTSFNVTGTTLSAADAGNTELTDVIFQGVYDKQEALQGDDIYIISGNAFYLADRPVTMKGYRAYIRLKTTAGVNRLMFDDMTTGITATEAATSNDKVDVYTLSGVRVKESVNAADALDGLRKGVYVVGGKKVVK